jgi:hypothetical protein
MLNEPSDFVFVTCSKPVATLWIFTLAFCTTAPELSVTVPLIEPRVCWLCAGEASKQTRPAQTRTSRAVFPVI